MKSRGLWQVFLAVSILAAVGCASTFSPQSWRREIERQTGARPRASFEFNLDGTTMQLARTVASKIAGEQVKFGGIDRIDLAVFELPSGKRLDIDRVRHRGWDKFIQTRTENTDLMILVRSNGETLADLVLVAQGEEQVMYGRLKGTLNPNLPSTLQKVVGSSGFKGLKDYMMSAAEEKKKPDEPPPAERKN